MYLIIYFSTKCPIIGKRSGRLSHLFYCVENTANFAERLLDSRPNKIIKEIDPDYFDNSARRNRFIHGTNATHTFEAATSLATLIKPQTGCSPGN